MISTKNGESGFGIRGSGVGSGIWASCNNCQLNLAASAQFVHFLAAALPGFHNRNTSGELQRVRV